jgi:hypothetical protein
MNEPGIFMFSDTYWARLPIIVSSITQRSEIWPGSPLLLGNQLKWTRENADAGAAVSGTRQISSRFYDQASD